MRSITATPQLALAVVVARWHGLAELFGKADEEPFHTADIT